MHTFSIAMFFFYFIVNNILNDQVSRVTIACLQIISKGTQLQLQFFLKHGYFTLHLQTKQDYNKIMVKTKQSLFSQQDQQQFSSSLTTKIHTNECCLSGLTARAALLPEWPCCQSGLIARAALQPQKLGQHGHYQTSLRYWSALLPKWSYCQSGLAARAALLPERPYCQSGLAARVALLPERPCCRSGVAVAVALLPKWPCCRSVFAIGAALCQERPCFLKTGFFFNYLEQRQ